MLKIYAQLRLRHDLDNVRHLRSVRSDQTRASLDKYKVRPET